MCFFAYKVVVTLLYRIYIYYIYFYTSKSFLQFIYTHMYVYYPLLTLNQFD